MAESAILFFRNNRVYGIGAIGFDLILDEQHNFNNSVTSFKIENGSNISDHIENERYTGSVSALITNFSLYENGLVTNRAQDAFDALELLWRSRELVDIVTVLRVYEQVAITSISIPRDNDTGESIRFSISFKEVNQVSLQQIVIEADIKILDTKTTINKQSTKNLDLGKTTPTTRTNDLLLGAFFAP